MQWLKARKSFDIMDFSCVRLVINNTHTYLQILIVTTACTYIKITQRFQKLIYLHFVLTNTVLYLFR